MPRLLEPSLVGDSPPDDLVAQARPGLWTTACQRQRPPVGSHRLASERTARGRRRKTKRGEEVVANNLPVWQAANRGGRRNCCRSATARSLRARMGISAQLPVRLVNAGHARPRAVPATACWTATDKMPCYCLDQPRAFGLQRHTVWPYALRLRDDVDTQAMLHHFLRVRPGNKVNADFVLRPKYVGTS